MVCTTMKHLCGQRYILLLLVEVSPYAIDYKMMYHMSEEE